MAGKGSGYEPCFSKLSNFKIPFFGRIIRKCCFMPIDRENPRKAVSTINRAAKLLRKQEVSIGVYPEGTRSKTCELLPFHNGVFKIAQKADAPIVVLSITGTERIAKRTPFKSTDVYLDVLEVFSGENIQKTKTELIGTAVRRVIEMNTERRDGAGRLRSLCMFPSIFKGKHVLHRNMVAVHTGDEITVEFDRPTPLQIDGETIPDVTKYTARSAMLNMEEKKDHDFLISVTGQVSNAAVRQ